MATKPGDQSRPGESHTAENAASVSSLIVGVRAGCDRSLGELAERYRRYLLLVANREISPDLQAKVAPSDLVQETLLHAGTSFERFNGSSEQELLAWLRRIMHFRALHAARRYQGAARQIDRECSLTRETEVDYAAVVDRAPTPLTRATAKEELADLNRALANLSADARQVVVMRTLERKSFTDIGAALGCSAEAARKRWARALTQLRSEWKHDVRQE